MEDLKTGENQDGAVGQLSCHLYYFNAVLLNQ